MHFVKLLSCLEHLSDHLMQYCYNQLRMIKLGCVVVLSKGLYQLGWTGVILQNTGALMFTFLCANVCERVLV